MHAFWSDSSYTPGVSSIFRDPAELASDLS